MREWSNEQKLAIDLRNREILVSAAAGSGKTSVLVQRIVEMVKDEAHPADVDRLLVVTFTKAAAAEMRSRLYDELLKEAQQNPANAHIRKQLMLVGQAHVQTIDSFCMYVLKNYFHTIDLDPSFRTGDEGELALMKKDVLDDLLEKKYADAEEAFLSMTDYFSDGKSDSRLEELVLQIFEFSRSSPDPDKWLSDCVACYKMSTEEELNQALWNRTYLEQVRETIAAAKASIGEIRKLMQYPNGPINFEKCIDEESKQLSILENFKDYRSLYDLMKDTKMKGDPTFGATAQKQGLNRVLYEEACRIHKRYSKQINDLKGVFDESPEEILTSMKIALPYVNSLIDLVQEFSHAFSAAKRDAMVVDFNDIEHFALDILLQDGQKTDVAKALSEVFEEIMIDEYQDSNMLQETILRAISRESNGHANIFMVGDVKQSIYRFRRACPELFVEKHSTFVPASDIETAVGQKIELNANYRSRPCVTEATNFVFGKIMHKGVGAIEYTENEALRPMGTFEETDLNVGGACRLMIADILGTTDDAADGGELQPTEASRVDGSALQSADTPEVDGDDLSKIETEATMIALKIRELVDPQAGMYVVDKEKGFRHASYRDIVVLMRSTAVPAEIFQNVFSTFGIPNYAERKTGFYGTMEVGLVMNLLTVISNPIDDIALAAVLTSPICGLSSEELATVQIKTKGLCESNGLFARVKTYLNQEDADPSLRGKLLAFCELIEKYRRFSEESTIEGLLRALYSHLGITAMMSSMPDGDRRLANLQQLIEKAKDYEKQSYQGVFNFIRYIEQKKQQNADEGEASIVSESDDIVRIITDHSSKGLEYPIVFVACLGRNFSKIDERATVCLHQDMGVGVDCFRMDERTTAPTYYKKVIKSVLAREALGEELRILYVAMTRAKERLFLTGYIQDAKEELESRETLHAEIGHQLTSVDVMAANSMLTWILDAYDSSAPIDIECQTKKSIARNRVDVGARDLSAVNRVKEELMKPVSEKLMDETRQIFDFGYRFDDLEEIPACYSVSQLKMAAMEAHLAEEDKPTREKHALVEDDKDLITGAERGTLYHQVMELQDPHRLTDDYDTRAEAARLTDPIEKSIINWAKVDAFWNSDLGRRFIAAYDRGQAAREQQFIVALPISEVLPGKDVKSPGETVMVQGIIDMFFEEPDGLVLVDYKTDRVFNGDQLVMRYKTQLDYYEKALCMLTGKRVKERYLYSFSLEKEIRC